MAEFDAAFSDAFGGEAVTVAPSVPSIPSVPNIPSIGAATWRR